MGSDITQFLTLNLILKKILIYGCYHLILLLFIVSGKTSQVHCIVHCLFLFFFCSEWKKLGLRLCIFFSVAWARDAKYTVVLVLILEPWYCMFMYS